MRRVQSSIGNMVWRVRSTILAGLLACSSMHSSAAWAGTGYRIALEVAGAFTNDGFKMRDGHWCGSLKPHDLALIAVNLYAGNQYWFSVGVIDPAKKVAVNVYDETGKQVTTENYSEGEKAAAGFSPSSSGQYFVSVDLVEGTASSFCLVYSYK